MSATFVQWHVLHDNMVLSKHSGPVFLLFCPLNQNLARVRTRGGGGCIAVKEQQRAMQYLD